MAGRRSNGVDYYDSEWFTQAVKEFHDRYTV